MKSCKRARFPIEFTNVLSGRLQLFAKFLSGATDAWLKFPIIRKFPKIIACHSKRFTIIISVYKIF